MDACSRRNFLAGLSALALGCAGRSSLRTSQGARSRPPNVLFLLADQFRHDALSCAGNRVVETPHLDRLARGGVRFTSATCAAPLCGPSRAAMLSGLYQHAHRCPGNVELTRPGMPEEVVTWDERLAAAGYHAEYFGKWHVGRDNRGCYANGCPDYLREYRAYVAGKYPQRTPGAGEKLERSLDLPYRPWHVEAEMADAARQGREMPHLPMAGELAIDAADSLTAWTAAQTVDFIRRAPDAPWSATCSILHPHAPLLVARPYSRMFDPARMPLPKVLDDVFTPPERAAIPDVVTLTPDGLGQFMALYYGLVKEVDDAVGRILAALEASGQAENTLIIFTADHGEMLGDHARVAKMAFYEASVRVPMILSLPGRIPAGKTMDAPANGVDLAATILDYAGVAGGEGLHGASLRGVIEGRTEPPGAYIQLGARPTLPRGQRILRTREWKLALWRGQPFLYHLADDPDETRNLLAAPHRQDQWVQQARSLQRDLLHRMEEIKSPETDWLASVEV